MADGDMWLTSSISEGNNGDALTLTWGNVPAGTTLTLANGFGKWDVDGDHVDDWHLGAAPGATQIFTLTASDGTTATCSVMVKDATPDAQSDCGHDLQSDLDRLRERAFFDQGAWQGDRFKHPCLHRLLLHFCGKDGIDPTAMDSIAVQGTGGDAASTTTGLPTWLQKWRNTVSNQPGWNDSFHLPRSRLAEAFLWTFLRQRCAQNSTAMAPSVDYLLEHLFKSNVNGKLGDAGGTGSLACAAVSGAALVRALSRRGYTVSNRYWMGDIGQNNPGKPPYFYYWKQAAEVAPLPGDILDWTGHSGPWSGHVVTIACPETDSYHRGNIWVISGNTGPGGTVAVDYVTLVRPYDGYSNSGPEGPRPPAGSVYPWAVCRCSAIMPDVLDGMDADGLAQLRVKKN